MEAIQQMAAVSGVLSLLVAVLWWLRRKGFAAVLPGKSRERRLECLERVALGPQQALHLIRLGGTALLLASSPAGCSLVTTRSYSELASGEAPK